MIRNIALGVLLSVCVIPLVNAASTSNANVLYAGIYGNGRLFVALSLNIPEPGCERNRFDVEPGHPQISHWYGIAVAAATSGKTVVVGTNGCYGILPTLDRTDNSYFYING